MRKSKKVDEFENILRERNFEQEKTDSERGINPDTAENIWIGSLFLLIIAHMLALIIRYIQASVNVEKYVISSNIIYIMLMIFLPFLWWMYSTKQDMWHFHKRKIMTLVICIFNAALTLGEVMWTAVWIRVVPLILMITPTRNVTAQMILDLARIALVLSVVILSWIVINRSFAYILNPVNKPAILVFRWQHHFDTRKNKENMYDLGIIKELSSGRIYAIKQIDRTLHMLINGASGTGKTATIIDRMFINDVNQKCQNMTRRVKEMLCMIKEGKLYVEPEEGREIGEYNVKAYPKYQKEYERLKKKYPDMGFTFMAPNNSENDNVIRMCKARGCMVNVIDPMIRYEDKNVKNLLINPFYLPQGLDLAKQAEVISYTGTMFAEVLQAVNEKDGTGDIYFRDINTSATSNIAIICMLYASIKGVQTYFPEIQACINDFQLLEPKVQKIQEEFGIQVSVAQIKQRGKKDAERNDTMTQNISLKERTRFIPKKSIDQVPEKYKKMGLEKYNEVLRDLCDSYYEPIHYVLTELLGPGSEKMFDQARGLRNLVNKLMLDPRVRRILSGKDMDIINFDQILLNNEITVINTALEIGAASSTALGLFIQLSLKAAILRRPKDARSLHINAIDEASQYMHPMYEDMIALYRQYGVGCVLAIQSLSQMDKTNVTKYLKGVIKGAGTHIVFGRVGDEEMKTYSEQGGLKDVNIVQEATTQSSIIETEPTSSESKRKQHDRTKVVEGSDIRIRDFQEVTVFSSDRGRVRSAIIGKTNFSQPSDFYNKHVKWVDWSKFVTSETIPEVRKEETKAKETVALKRTDIQIDSTFEETKSGSKYTNAMPNMEYINKHLEQKATEISVEDIETKGDVEINIHSSFNDFFTSKEVSLQKPKDAAKSALDRLNSEGNKTFQQ